MDSKNWGACQVRLTGAEVDGRVLGFAFRKEARRSQTDLFFRSEASPSPCRLPAVLFPLHKQDGEVLTAKDLEAQRKLPQDGSLFEGVVHHSQGSFPVVWCHGLTAAEALVVQEALSLQPGLYISDKEEAFVLGDAQDPLFIHPLPRIVSKPEDRAADNTDPERSMDRLLQRFVQQFSDSPAETMPHISIATGYLYRRGLERVLLLLNIPQLKSLRLLFSGRADRSTVELLEQVFLEPLDQEESGANTQALYTAVSEGRLEVRVYPHAFLHAKLYLGWRFVDTQGFPKGSAVVGSSNVTGPGLMHAGNLELNVFLEDRYALRSLRHWFDARWEEAEAPRAELLEALEARKQAVAPPTFQLEGMKELWRAGKTKSLAPAAEYLDFLARLYRDRIGLTRVDLEQPSFPRDEVRQITPAPEQESGVLALAQRLLQLRFAFLADSVGLGKTITSLGTAWYLYRLQEAKRIVIIAPKKLMAQWESDRQSIRMPSGIVEYQNRHVLERKTEQEALAILAPYDLILVEEAHQMLRSRKNKLWSHLRAHLRLRKNLDTRLLLISATPWNNTREDIFNYILLAWHDGRSLWNPFPIMAKAPVRRHLEYFTGKPGPAAKNFCGLALGEYQAIFGETFVQRTRHRLRRLYQNQSEQRRLDFPTRNIIPYSLPASEAHDDFFNKLEATLEQLFIPYREPFRALQRAVAATLSDLPEELQTVPASNLHRSFIIQLYKRAESSFFALAVSLHKVLQRLEAFESELAAIVYTAKAPRDELKNWMEKQYLRLKDERAFQDGGGFDEDLMSAAEKARYGNLRKLFEQIDDESVKQAVRHMIESEIARDHTHLEELQKHLELSLQASSPKELYAMELLKLHHEKGLKLVMVAGYTDTVLATFVRAIEAAPDARIGLAMGGNEAWLYDPKTCHPSPFSQEEWEAALEAKSAERRKHLLADTNRAQSLPRALLLRGFSPRAQKTPLADLERVGGEIDFLIGSEAISIGQNLQDATALFQLDLPWNPMVIEQRIGRIDRRGGGRHKHTKDPNSPKIVDIYYCWSHAAVENEIALRDKLKEKTEGAIQDTRFDELLLYELRELVEEIRRASGELPVEEAHREQLSAFLQQKQQELLEKQTMPEDITEQAGATMEGIRHLATWAEEQQLDLNIPSLPVVASAFSSPGHTSASWQLTLALQPKGHHGQNLGPTIYESLILLQEHLPPEIDLEAVVLALRDAEQRQAHRNSPMLSPKDWNQTLLQLEQRLLTFGQKYLEQHNERIQQKAQDQRVQLDPSQKFRMTCDKARKALQHELKTNPYYQTDSGKAMIASYKDKLKFLLQQLTPAACHRLLQEGDERSLEATLQVAIVEPRRFFQEEFEENFLNLLGALWAEAQEEKATPPAVQMELGEDKQDYDVQREAERAAEGRWSKLDVRLVAAAYVL